MQQKTTKRYFCTKCGSYQEFTVTSGMARAGDHGFCNVTVWNCKACGFSPFLPPKEEGAADGKGDSSNS